MHSARNAVTAVAISAAPVVAGADGGGRTGNQFGASRNLQKFTCNYTHTHYMKK